MNGEVSHLEIGAVTGAQSSKFFASLFGWSFHPMGDGEQGWFKTPSCKAGLHAGDPKPGFSVYFSVSDIEQAVALVNQLGGQAEAISPEEPGFGRFCTCRDPEGVQFGLHQPAAN